MPEHVTLCMREARVGQRARGSRAFVNLRFTHAICFANALNRDYTRYGIQVFQSAESRINAPTKLSSG